MPCVLLSAVPHQARRVLRLSGGDARRFAQGTLTADLDGLPPDEARASALCTPKGKIVAEVIAIAGPQGAIDLVVPEDIADAVAAALDAHIIMDDVVVTSIEGLSSWAVWGEPPVDGAAVPDVRVLACRHPVPGQLVVGPDEAVAGVLARVPAGDTASFTAARIDAGVPGWRHELVPDVFPPEAGFIDAVSYAKGCFMGQEPLARIHARGQVQRVMVRVRIAGTPDAVELSAPERADVGRLTTWVPGRDTALAIVRRAWAVPGTTLTGPGLQVEVLSDPIGDDPGTPGRA